jgi:hypothetical protein
MSLARIVQPVLDRYCIGCHGLDLNAQFYGDYSFSAYRHGQQPNRPLSNAPRKMESAD